MAYIDVSAWSPEHVIYWMRGVHSSLESECMNQLVRQRVNGNRLMLLASQDIIDLIPSIKVEALQAIVQGIDSLRALSHNSTTETLQSLTLTLACQAKYLYNQLIQAEHSPRLLPVSSTSITPITGGGGGNNINSNYNNNNSSNNNAAGTVKNRFDFTKVDSNMQINQSTKQRVSLETLDSVSLIVDQILQVVAWLNSLGLAANLSKFNKDFKSIVLRVAVELTSTAQRDQFVEQPNDILKKTSKFLADYCEWVVLAIDDPDFIQPCWLDVVSVKRRPEEDDFGIGIQQATLNSLLIEEVVFSSAAHRSGRINVGDEIIQIDYQTVVGWPQDKVKHLIRSFQGEIILTIKKKPVQVILNPSIVVIKPYAIPLKRVLSHSSDSHVTGSTLDSERLNDFGGEGSLERQPSFVDNNGMPVETSLANDDDAIALEPPKEPKGPVYPELQTSRVGSRRELKRRMSISGDISDALVDLSLADSLPIPSLNKTPPPSATAAANTGTSDNSSTNSDNNNNNKSKLGRITKETLTKSVSHDTAKLYLHTLSIDRKHLWLPKAQGGGNLNN